MGALGLTDVVTCPSPPSCRYNACMNADIVILLTPVIDSRGEWSGVWGHGGAGEAGVIRDRLLEQLPRMKIFLDDEDSQLATGIHDAAQFDAARSRGASWFCGDYLIHPPLLPGRPQEAGRTSLLRLLTLVAQDADTAEIEQVFKHEPALSFHLFRLVNSPGMGLAKKISTFNEAIMVLGRRQLQRWVQLLLYASKQGDEASPLLSLAAMRGRLMENLGVARGRDIVFREQAFMTGIFSLLDSLLGMSMDEVMQAVRPPAPVQRALLEQQGELGELLLWVQDVQAGRSVTLPGGIDAAQCVELQLDALRWALDVGAGIG